MNTTPRYFLISPVGGTTAGAVTFGVKKVLGINFDFYFTGSGSSPVATHFAASSRRIVHTLAPTLVNNNLPVFLRPWNPKFFSTVPFAKHVVSTLDGKTSTKDLPNLKIAVAVVDAEFSNPVHNGQSVHYAILDAECDIAITTALAASCACPPITPITIKDQKVKLVVDDGNGGKKYELVTVEQGKILDPGMIEKIPLTAAFLDATSGDVFFVINLGIQRIQNEKIIELFEEIVNYPHFDKLAKYFLPFSFLRFILLNEINKHKFDMEKYRKIAREKGVLLVEININHSQPTKKSIVDTKVLLPSLAAIIAGIKAWDELQKASQNKKNIFNYKLLLSSLAAIIAAIKACKELEKILYENTPLNKRSIFDSRNIPDALYAGICAGQRALEEHFTVLEQPKIQGDLSDIRRD